MMFRDHSRRRDLQAPIAAGVGAGGGGAAAVASCGPLVADIAGLALDDDDRALLRHPSVSGVVLFLRNFQDRDQLRELAYSYIDTIEDTAPTLAAPSTDSTDAVQGDDTSGKTADLATHLRSAADKIFNYVDKTNFATLGTFGMVGIFLSVILVLGQIEKSLNVIWKVKDGRSILRKVADYIALMILFPISINVALAAGTMLSSQALNVHLDKFLPILWLQTLLLKGVPVLFLSLTLYVIYIFLANGDKYL